MEDSMSTETAETESLDEQIACALRETADSKLLPGLIKQAEEASAALEAEAQDLRAVALDPILSPPEVVSARREFSDAEFNRDRMQEAVVRLKERLQEMKTREQQQRLNAKYEQVMAERDKLAEELEQVYPAACEQLAGLIERLAENDRWVEHINTSQLPVGAARLRSAELVARGRENYLDGPSHVARITHELCLPAFHGTANDRYAWPRPR
jgi:uncharacterized protein YicC (UPF0701 family)